MRGFLYCILAFLCVSCQRHEDKPAGPTLSVALYPYLQQMDDAKRIIGEIWDRHNSGWMLEFKDWDCYLDDPRTDIDVFCIDCLFEQYYMNEGMISTISNTEIMERDDFYDCFNLSDECIGIPFLLCQDFLIYPSRDKQIADAYNARKLLDCAEPGNIWTLTAGNPNGIYLRAWAEIYGYEGSFHTTDINQSVLENLKPYLVLGGKKALVAHSEETARAFIAGNGRAYVGFPEVLSLLQEYPEPLSIINFSIFGNRRSNYYYADKICINKSVTNKEKRKAAILLANILCSREFLERYISNESKCLFYIPARPSVSRILGQGEPVYHSIDSLASANDALILYGDAAFRDYNDRILSKMAEVLDDVSKAPTFISQAPSGVGRTDSWTSEQRQP